MASILDQIKDLTTRRQVLIDQLIEALRADVRGLNKVGFAYELVEISAPPAGRKKRTGTGAVRWATSITRATNASRAGKLSKAQALQAVRTALERLGREKGVEVPSEVLAAAEKTLDEAYGKK